MAPLLQFLAGKRTAPSRGYSTKFDRASRLGARPTSATSNFFRLKDSNTVLIEGTAHELDDMGQDTIYVTRRVDVESSGT